MFIINYPLSSNGGVNMETVQRAKIQDHLAHAKVIDNRVVDINAPLEALTGYSKDELIGKTEDELIKILRINFSCQDNPPSIHEDYYLFTKSHDAKKISISLNLDKALNIKYYIFKEKKQFQIGSILSAFNQLLGDKQFGIALLSMPEAIILRANQTYLDSLDSPFNSFEKIIGYRLKDIVNPENSEIINEVWDNYLQLGMIYHEDEFRYDGFKRGTTYWINTLIPIAENNKVKYAIHISREITETVINRKIVEEQSKIIAQQRDQTFKILEILDIPIARISYPELKVIKLNDKMIELMTKLRIGETYNLKNLDSNTYIYEIIKNFNSKENLNNFKKMEDTRSALYYNNIEYFSEKIPYYFNIVCQPYINSNGDITELIFIAYDITDEISKNRALIDAMRMQEEFFSFISHEFKTPLSIINAAVQVLQLLFKDKMPIEANQYIKKIQRSALQQIRLVNSLLDITRAGSGYLKLNRRNMDIVQATQAIVESVSVYAESKRINLQFKSLWKKKITAMDDEKYERILLNLLSNAIKFTPEGKSIKVTLSEKKDIICIQVKDEGVGIPKDKINLIFERFGQVSSNLTRDSEGTGIGLYLVKTLVNALGGEILVESAPDKGSTFTVNLPEFIAEYGDNHKHEIADSRLIQAANIEFSNIYLE